MLPFLIDLIHRAELWICLDFSGIAHHKRGHKHGAQNPDKGAVFHTRIHRQLGDALGNANGERIENCSSKSGGCTQKRDCSSHQGIIAQR